MDPALKQGYRLDAVVTVVDAYHVTQHLVGGATQHGREGSAYAHNAVNEAHEQIAFADTVLLNKVDLVERSGGSSSNSSSDGSGGGSPAARFQAVADRVQSINSTAVVIPCTRSVPCPSPAPGQPPLSRSATSIAALLSQNAFDPKRIAMLPTYCPAVPAGGSSKGSLHGLSTGLFSKSAAPSVLSAAASPSDEVITISLVIPGSVDLDKFNMWIAPLLQAHGSDIFRTKGLLSVKDDDAKYVFHSVHMVFEGSVANDLKWPTAADDGADARKSTIVLIGRLQRAGLTRSKLEREFAACAAPGQ